MPIKFLRRHARLMAVAISCAAIGAGASAIATAGAATSTPSSTHSASRGLAAARLRRLGWARRAVQGEAVVRTRSGWATVRFARGFVDSVHDQQLTLTEGTRRASYRTVTLTIPSGALVRDDGQRSSLPDLKSGQRVIVLQGPAHTFVAARTPRTSG